MKLTNEEFSKWRMFMFWCKNNNIKVKMFSNAHTDWLRHFMDPLGVSDDIYEINDYIESFSHLPLYNTLVKPSSNFYMLSKNYLKKYLQCEQAIYIDDNLFNFQNIENDSEFWVNIWCNDCASLTPYKIKDNLYAINSIHNMNNMSIFLD